jgi:transposase
MISVRSDVRVWLASGHTDMRKGMAVWRCWSRKGWGGIRLPGTCSCFVGNGSLIKALWHDGVGLSLYAKRLERGRFIWPSTVGDVHHLTAVR